MAEPHLGGIETRLLDDRAQRRERINVLDVDAQVVIMEERACVGEERNVARKLVDIDVSDGSTSQTGTELAVVIEHDRSVTGDPSVGLYTGCPKT